MKRIFGIGLSRTGTLSLANALGQVGINIIHYPNKIQLFDPKSSGACDIPVVVYYKELDKKFPNSKFIYTIRDKAEWLTSIEERFNRYPIQDMHDRAKEYRTKVYGQLDFDSDKFAETYDTYDKDVREYFRERPQDLLILNICAGEGWEELISFLGVSNKSHPNCFPHKNKKTG